MKTSHRIGFAVVSVAVLAVATACGTEHGTSANDEASNASKVSAGPAPAPADPTKIIRAFSATSYDFTPVATGVLVQRSKAVVLGTVAQVVPGRIDGALDEADPLAFRTTAIAIDVQRSLKGDMTRGDTVWVEVLAVPAEVAGALPVGTTIGALLVPAEPSSEGYPRGTAGSKVPADAELWNPTNPQSLIIGLGDRGVVTPLDGNQDPSGHVAASLGS